MNDLIARLEAATGPEQWRPVAEAPGIYEVSNLGRIRSRARNKPQWMMLNFSVPAKGYPAVSIHAPIGRIRRNVHALVAAAFLPPRPSHEHEVRHLDGNPGNCRADNLAWGTRKENAADRTKHGRTAAGDRHGMRGVSLAGTKNGYAKLNDADIRNIRTLSGSLTQRDIAANFGITQGQAWRIIHRKAWAHVF